MNQTPANLFPQKFSQPLEKRGFVAKFSSLKVGIKIGPHDWLKRLEASQAKYVEVWFNISKVKDYHQMFAYLKKHHIHTGLHFWGTIDNTWEPNIAYPGRIVTQTLKLVTQAIDIAAENKFDYVNIHSGNMKPIRLDLEANLFIPDTREPKIPLAKAKLVQRQSLLRLTRYAKSKHVLLLTETIPANTSTISFKDPNYRQSITSQFSLPVSVLIKRCQADHIFITNDFCHTFADEFDQPLNQLWQALHLKTKTLAPFTKLLHLSTVTKPYNGTDYHGGITANDFKNPGTFPTRKKLIKLLSLFKHRDDVWVINEPTSHHVENYQALIKLISEL